VQRIIQMSNVILGLLIRCFQAVPQSAASILPFSPQTIPHSLCDFTRRKQPGGACFLIVNRL